MSVKSSLAQSSSSDPTVLRLDLGRQRLLIEPDAPAPRFYPRPRVVMVIPIYEDADLLLGPNFNIPQSQSDGKSGQWLTPSVRDQRPHHLRQQQQQEKPVKPSDRLSLLRRRHSVHSTLPLRHGPSHGNVQNYIEEVERNPPSAARRQSFHKPQHNARPPTEGYRQLRIPPLGGKQQQHLHKPERYINRPPTHSRRYDDSRYHEDSYDRPSIAPSESLGQKPYHGHFLRSLRERHEAFHEAIRTYFDFIPPHPEWTRSHCTGRKKAVCIGINYIGQKHELKGCANDARSMRDFLIQRYSFSPSDIILLTDDDRRNRKPTRDEMLKAIGWLVRGAHPHDSLFFHYSGHGGQVEDETGREIDGMNEDIFPLDHSEAGVIIDDELHNLLVDPLPPGCRLTALFDSCHSGTVLDLPYIHSAHGRLRGIGHVSKRARDRGIADSADVICFSACRDDETAADTFMGGIPVGAMSYAFVDALKNDKHWTYDELLTGLRKTLIPRYRQKPQISCTHPLELEHEFTL